MIVSGTLIPGSIPAFLISLALQRTVQLYLSPAILAEYREVLLRSKLGFQSDTIHTFLKDLQKTAVMVYPSQSIAISPNEPDNQFIECAVTANAGYIVTGNTRHSPVVKYKDIQIVSPAEFAALLIK